MAAILTALENSFLPEVAGAMPEGNKRSARRTDPNTSQLAADIDSGQFDGKLRMQVLREFMYALGGLLTDDDLRDALGERIGMSSYIEKTSVTKRRGELVDAGILEDSGLRASSDHGRDMVLWKVSPEWHKRVATGLAKA